MSRVYVSAVMNASIDQAWSVLRDFNGLADYHPFFATSTIEDGRPADQVGCVRRFTNHEGERIREQLLTLSDHEYVCTYRILEGPLPVEHYLARMQLWPVTEGNRTFGEWWAEFEVSEADRDWVDEQVGATFREAFKSVSERFGG